MSRKFSQDVNEIERLKYNNVADKLKSNSNKSLNPSSSFNVEIYRENEIS